MQLHQPPYEHSRRSPSMRVAAWLVIVAMLAGCTRDVVRGPMDTRHYSVDMDRLDARRIVADSLEIDSVVLTPAQWPLEASFKNLFQGDFVGVFDNFDLSFRSSRLRNDTLERLFDEGYLPVFLRVRNPGAGDARFIPGSLVVLADKGTTLYPVSADDLPGRFSEIDWGKTGLGVVLVALMVVLIVASAKEGRSGGRGLYHVPRTTVSITDRGRSRRSRRGRGYAGLDRRRPVEPHVTGRRDRRQDRHEVPSGPGSLGSARGCRLRPGRQHPAQPHHGRGCPPRG